MPSPRPAGCTAAALAATLTLATLAFTAQAATPIEQRLTAEQVHATGLDTLRPDQLALLNRLLEGASVPTPATAATAAPAAGEGPATLPSPFAGAQDGPVKGRLVGTIDGWAPGSVFEFEDGQRWQVLKGQLRLRRPLTSPDVVVVPGVMGRWFLQVSEDLPKARVQRVR